MRRSVVARLLRSWVRIPPRAWMSECVVSVVCVVRWRSLRRADHSSRGVLPIVMRRCLWSRNLMNEEAMTRVGPQRHRKKSPQGRAANLRSAEYYSWFASQICVLIFAPWKCYILFLGCVTVGVARFHYEIAICTIYYLICSNKLFNINTTVISTNGWFTLTVKYSPNKVLLEF